MKKIFSSKYFFAITSIIISSYVLLVFVKSPGINDYERSMFPDMIYGKAWKPFVYRTLLPTTVRILTSVVSESARKNLGEWIESNDKASLVFNKLKWESEYASEYIVAMLLMFLSLIGFVYAYKYFFGCMFKSVEWFANTATLTALLALPVMYKYTSFVYDFPALFLFTLALGLMIRKKWIAFLIIYFLSCINKETTILLTLIFWIYFRHGDKINSKLFKQLLFVQFILFAVIKIVLYIIFRNNAGTFVEFHLIDHTLLLFNGFTLTTFTVWLGLLILLTYKWSEKPKFLKDTLWILVPLVILTFFLGFYDELRDYYEVYPSITMLIAFSIGKILNVQIEDNSPNI